MKRGKLRWLCWGCVFSPGYAPHILEHGWSLAVERALLFRSTLVLLAMMRVVKASGQIHFAAFLSSLFFWTLVCLYLRIHASVQGATWFVPLPLRVRCALLRCELDYYDISIHVFREIQLSSLLLGLFFSFRFSACNDEFCWDGWALANVFGFALSAWAQ